MMPTGELISQMWHVHLEAEERATISQISCIYTDAMLNSSEGKFGGMLTAFLINDYSGNRESNNLLKD